MQTLYCIIVRLTSKNRLNHLEGLNMTLNPDHQLRTQTLIMKFGGTSVGTSEAMSNVVDIVRAERARWQNMLVVTSALSGVTDTLLQMAHLSAAGETSQVVPGAQSLLQRHQQMADALIADTPTRQAVIAEISELIQIVANLCQAMAVIGESTPKVMDIIASTGERLCIRLLSAALQSAGVKAAAVEASSLICTDDHYMDAHPDLKQTALQTSAVIHPLFEAQIVPVVTGFMGATASGNITTLGRGGSDYSAALLGAALQADEVWIFTDVNGVMTADPRLVPDAFTVPVCTYREIAELAYYGAKVLHPKTIRPVIEAGIGLRVCNTFNPQHPGTRLVAESEQHKGVIKAITSVKGLVLVTLEGRGMLGVPGVAARTFDAVAKLNTSILFITQASSEQSICFAVPVNAKTQVVEKLKTTFAEELRNRDIDFITATDEVGIITVVGAGMANTPGVAGRIFSILGQHTVNVRAIAQGSSEVAISLVIDAQEIQRAVSVLHQLILPVAAQAMHQV